VRTTAPPIDQITFELSSQRIPHQALINEELAKRSLEPTAQPVVSIAKYSGMDPEAIKKDFLRYIQKLKPGDSVKVYHPAGPQAFDEVFPPIRNILARNNFER